MTTHYPEMQGESIAEIQAIYSGVVNKYRVTVPFEIEIKRGITFDSIVDEFGSNGCKNKRAGYFKYYMTETAFRKFTKENETTLNILLD